MSVVSWEELVGLEPRLGALLEEARGVADPGGAGGFCREVRWRGLDGGPSLERAVRNLVGWEANPPDVRLVSWAAYRVAAETIRNAMPPCRPGAACGCVSP